MHTNKTTILLLHAILWLCIGSALSNEGSELDGVIEPSMSVELGSRIDGILETVYVDVGDTVSKHQVVANLEAGVERAAMEHAKARAAILTEIRQHEASLAFGQRQLKRITRLHTQNLVPQQDFDEIKTETKISQYKLSQAKENLHLAELNLAQSKAAYNRHIIRSPIDGVVIERFRNPGESVEDKPIVKIVQINPLRVEVVAPINMLGKIKPGQLATVMPESPINGEFEAVVQIVDPTLDAASGTFRIRLDLPNDKHALTSGLRCRVRFLDSMVSQQQLQQNLPPQEQATPEQDEQIIVTPQPETTNPIDVQQITKMETQPMPTATPNQLVESNQVNKIIDPNNRYLLVTRKPLLPLEKAESQVDEFSRKGLTDTWVILDGTLQGHISIGYFNTHKIAMLFQQQLTSMGVETKIIEQ